MTKPPYDDEGWLRMEFTDGSHCIIVAYYYGYTGDSLNEYPTGIKIEGSYEGLVPLHNNQERQP